MKKNKKSFQGTHSNGLSKKLQEEKKDLSFPNPDDPHEKKGPPIKEMPLNGSPDHPHNEEILDGMP